MNCAHSTQTRLPRIGCSALTAAILSLSLVSPAVARDPAFRRHDLNPESTYSACAAIDVNRDGRLDAVCGGWWYEAPSWKKHFLRDVEVIRGRYDDYSNLALDVDGDGWLDLVSANYRSQKIYWIEHPGKTLGPWSAHLIAQPGPMETARLADVDGDGLLDVLPNETKSAGWWKLVRDASGTGTIRWVRHALPNEIAGHGLGFGDIDGDGRGDLVGPRGWLKAPQKPRQERWYWNPEFTLHRDCSIPILVFDVDGDGDNDIVWARGHQTGLYWLEQISNANRADPASSGPSPKAREWTFHVIDTSWSQAHSLLLGDLNNDGTTEVIAGKRYMGHDGKDLGEYDPMQICSYQFDRQSKTWHRNLLSFGGGVGFGLDPKVVDLDGDGDQDLLCPGRSGLYWLENLLIAERASAHADRPGLRVPSYRSHAELLVYKDGAGQEQPVRSHADWAIRRAHLTANMQLAMGPLPDSSQRAPLDVRVVDETQTPNYVRRTITFVSEPGDRVPAYLLMPKNARSKTPAMLCLHQTTRIGKGEPAGLGGKPTLHYAHELADRGFICLVPDYPSFGDYQYDFKHATNRYVSGSMKAVWNNIRAIDLLESLPETDRDQIGIIGHSLGGHNSMFTAVFDQRIQAIVSSCGYTPFHDYYGGKLRGWTSDRYMPRIRDVYHSDPDQVPFDFYEIVAAFAPRAFFSNSPLHDSNFEVAGVKKAIQAAQEIYALTKAKDKLKVVYPDSKHDFPDDIRQQAYEWLEKQFQ